MGNADDGKAGRETYDTQLDVGSLGSGATRDALEAGASAAGELGAPALDARYAMRRALGHGGMGEVHLCHDALIGRDVAVKVRRRGQSASGDDEARFLREARVQGQLEHPAIVPVYDLVVGPEGAQYFTMKRIHGHTLADLLRALRDKDAPTLARWSRRKLLTAFGSVCLAIDFAHQHRVVHRDLKPANVMLGDFGEVYVLDWGIAKLLGEEGDPLAQTHDASADPRVAVADATPLATHVGAMLGTPGYMAPEQILGRAVDARADVFGLGAILFELLALEPLHRGKTNLELLTETTAGTDNSPAARSPEADVPPELDALVVSATHVDPAKRLASARALSEAIESYLDGDRDLALRRTLADAHAASASKHAEEALSASGPAVEPRREAMRELSRALALDPEHPVARRRMVELLTRPPRELPPEVRDELDGLQASQVRVGGRTGALAFLSINLYAPLLLWLGVIDVGLLVLQCALATLCAGVSYSISRLRRPTQGHAMIVLVISSVGIVVQSTIAGPFIVVPAVVTASTLIFSVSNGRAYRGAIIAVGCLAFLAPFALEALGVLAPAATFGPSGMTIVARMTELPPTRTTLVLVVMTLGTIVTSGLAVAPFRDELDDAQRQIRLQSWQLRQLVPDDTIAR
ncbi:MAG: serine/threonine protein kinase, partial [Deltaproteobacteria bacterium]|nr:serine/threonine protein kinase [Deltaproteobacteria bacterium]